MLVEQLGVNASLASPFAQLQSRQFRLLDRPLDPLFIAPLLQFLAQIVKSRNGVRVANGAPLVSAADGFAEQVVEQGSVRVWAVPDHVPGEILEERDLVLAGCA